MSKSKQSALKNGFKQYTEAELIWTFNLDKVKTSSPLMQQWLETSTAFNDVENVIIDNICSLALDNIEAWNEEDLKMNFISFVLHLGHMTPSKRIRTFFDKIIQGTVDDHLLRVKADFIMAKGILDMLEIPYFHFQGYKRQTDPNGNPMAQLLTAMLIARAANNNNKPIYGCSVIGKFWDFVILDNKTYYVSASYDCIDKEKLKQIVAILRNFRNILENKLII